MGLLRKEAVGKTYDPVTYEVTRKEILAYARSYGDDRPEYAEVAPLMFAVVYGFEAGLKPLFDEALSPDPMKMLRRLVRGSLDVETMAPVRPGDVLSTRGRIVSIEEKASGEVLEIETITDNQRGEQVAIVKNVQFIRGEKKEGQAAAAPTREDSPPLPIDWETRLEIPAELPIAYADASLDRNPIHTDDAFAKMAGFRGIILQGSATLALAQRAVIDAVCGGDSRKLGRLRARFKKPVYPGDTLLVQGSRLGAFLAQNQEGARVLDDGAFEAEGMNR